MPIIHGVNASPFVRKVRVACLEKGIEYELDPQLPFGERTEYRKISPLGKIPCWTDGDFALPDSTCILAYLERLHPQTPLYPQDPELYGRALWYEEYGDSKVVEALGTVFVERFVKPHILKQQCDEAKVTQYLEKEIPPILDYLEGEIADRSYLVGERFSIADIGIASPFVNFRYAGGEVDAKRWPRLVAYLERILGRPSFKGLIEEEMASMPQS